MLRITTLHGLALAGCLILIATAQSTAIWAKDFAQGNLTIENPWARATDKMAKTSAAYLVVKNAGAAADTLVGVAADVAESVQLHHMVHKDGMMSMQHVDAIPVPAKGSATLKPGGYHVMFVGLKSQLKPGDTFPLHLTFEKAGKVTVEVTVLRPDGSPAAMGKDHGSAKKGGNQGMGGMKH